MAKISFFDVKLKKKILIDEKDTKPVTRGNRHFLTAKSPESGITMWRIVSKNKK